MPSSSASISAPGTISAEKKALAVFPSDLLPAFHPCDPDVTFTEMQGQNEVTYTDELLYNADGTPSNEHNIRYSTTETQKGRDKNGKTYGAQKTESGKSFFMTSGSGKNSVSHVHMEGEKPCTTTSNENSASGDHGQDCTRSFDSSPSYQFVLVENPLTREATLFVTTVGISSTCPIDVIAMREP